MISLENLKFLLLVLLLTSCNGESNKKISVECNETIEVSSRAIARISAINHLQSPQRCPGFFAELPDDSKFSTAQEIRQKVDENSCGNVEPAGHDRNQRQLTSAKRESIDGIVNLLDYRIMNEYVVQMSRPVAEGGLWDSRYHNLKTANAVPEWIKNQISSFTGRKVSVTTVEHTNTPQRSIEALIPSVEPSNKYLILGAHLDSTNRNDKLHAPGANDNASGSAVLLETLRVLLKSKIQPKVNIVFYWYAAEEIGLVGSQEIARMYAEQKREVLGVMNLDMAFYTPRNPKSIYLIRDYTDRKLTSRIKFLAKTFGFKPRYVRCGYACSDHGSWTRYGFPSFFSRDDNTRGNFRRLHTLKDVLDDKLNAKHALRFAILAVAYTVDYATE